MTKSLQKNATAKVSSVTRSGGGRGGGSVSDCENGMPTESYFQIAMGDIRKKYFRGYEQGYVSVADYKKISKYQQQAVYHLHQERDGIRRPAAGTDTPKDYANLKRHVSALFNKVDGLLTTDEPSSDEGGDKTKKVKSGGNKLNQAFGHQ